MSIEQWPHRQDIEDAVVYTMQKEINRYIAEGTIPATVASFSELHDYIDANMLAEDWFAAPTDDETDEEGEARMDANAELFNPTSDRVDAWLKAGRPPVF